MRCKTRMLEEGSPDSLVYSRAMAPAAVSKIPRDLSRVLGWRRVRVVLITSLLLSMLVLPGWQASWGVLFVRLVFVGLVQLLVFGLFERWPRRLPRWLARWVLQVVGVAIVVPFALAIVYSLTTFGDAVPLDAEQDRAWRASAMMTGLGILLAPWIAMSALYRHISGEAQRQALAFELERSEFERKALDARLRLLQAQVEPHFLFNTLANVRELVDSGSPQASTVLGSLIAYLRAAVPRLHEPATTMGQELELVRAYLEVMHMRMPDRLQFTLHADDEALALRCPPMTLLTLVENAVRHGIDPSEEGGRIEVHVRVRDGRCRAQVIDTGVGLQQAGDGLGTGLSNLRERLQLAFGGDAQLRLSCARSRTASAPRSSSRRGGARHDAPTSDRADRRRRAAAAQAARAPARGGLARAGRGRAGAQRSRGGRAVRGAAARHLLPRRAHAGLVGRRGRALHRSPRAPRVRHRVRPVRGAGLRAGRARLPGEAGRARAPRRHGGAAAGTAARRAAAAPTPRRCWSSSRRACARTTARRRCAGSARRSGSRCA